MKEQRVVTIFKGLNSLHTFNLNPQTEKINLDGWEVIQVISTSFEQKHEMNAQFSKPTIAITLLCQREKNQD